MISQIVFFLQPKMFKKVLNVIFVISELPFEKFLSNSIGMIKNLMGWLNSNLVLADFFFLKCALISTAQTKFN